MKVLVDLAARADLDSAREFYDHQEPGLGDECVDYLLSCLDELSITAGIHASSRSVYRWYVQGRFPYFGIFYVLRDDVAIVRAILDMRRDPQARQRTLRLRFL